MCFYNVLNRSLARVFITRCEVRKSFLVQPTFLKKKVQAKLLCSPFAIHDAK